MFFCEFKAEGKKPTPSQEREHTRLRQQNVQVYVVDSIDQGKDVINSMCAGLGLRDSECFPDWLKR
jgi:hypothetical protein